MDSLAQSTENNKFTKSLQYLEKEVKEKVDFCTDQHQSIPKSWHYHIWWVQPGMPKMLKKAMHQERIGR